MSDEHDVPIDTMQEPVAQGQPEARWEWMKQLDELLVWLQHRWLPLAAIVLFSSLLLFQSYVSKTGIVVSLSGAETLALMPIVFAMAAFAIVAVAFFVAMPALLLTTRLNEEADSLMRGMTGLERGGKERRSAGNKMLRGWFIVWGVMWVTYIALIIISSKIETRWNEAYIIFALMLAGSALLSILYADYLRVDKSKRISFDYFMNVVLAGVSQTVFISLSMGWTFQNNSDSGLSWFMALVVLGGLFLFFMIICLIQIMLAFSFVSLRHQYNLFKGAVLVGLSALVVVSFWPPLGGFLMSKTFVGTVLGEKQCAHILWRESATGPHALLVGDGERRSVPVKILADIGGTLQVRPVGQVRPVSENNQVVYLVPVSELAAVESCPRSADE